MTSDTLWWWLTVQSSETKLKTVWDCATQWRVWRQDSSALEDNLHQKSGAAEILEAMDAKLSAVKANGAATHCIPYLSPEKNRKSREIFMSDTWRKASVFIQHLKHLLRLRTAPGLNGGSRARHTLMPTPHFQATCWWVALLQGVPHLSLSAPTHLHWAWTSLMVIQQLYLETLPWLEIPVRSPAL